MKIFKNISPLAINIVLILFISICSRTLFGSTFESEERIHISNLHHISEDFYGFAEDITIDGLIDGDLITFCNNMKINGDINGSVSSFSYVFSHTGSINRSLRSFSYSAEISGYVGRSLLIGANTVTINEGSVIEQDAQLFGAHIYMDGNINGTGSFFAGDTIEISGSINGDVRIAGNKIYIYPTAVINGNLLYETKDTSDLEISEGALISGEVNWKQDTGKSEDESEKEAITAIVLPISKFLAAFLFGVIIISLFNRYAKESFNQLHKRFMISMATGFLSVLIFIFSILIFLFSFIFMIIGLIVVAGDSFIIGAIILTFSILLFPISSFLTVCGGIIFYTGKIVVGLLLGYFIFHLLKPSPAKLKKTYLFVGLLILSLLFSLPYYVGTLIYLFTSIVGGGAIVLSVHLCHKLSGEQSILPEDKAGNFQ